MTKAELIKEFSMVDSFKSKAEAGRALETLITIITEKLSVGEEVILGQDFGRFKVATQSARTARVPGTTKTVEVPAKKVVKFKVGKPLADKVAAGKHAKKAAKKK